MLDELLDVFDRDRRSDGRKPRKGGLRGLLARFTDGDRDDHDRDRERRRYDDDRYDRDHERSDRRDRRRYDFDDD